MFKIFDEKEKDSTVVLRLVRSGETIHLAVVGKDGIAKAGGFLLEFNKDGTFSRRSGVSAEMGIKVLNGQFVERV